MPSSARPGPPALVMGAGVTTLGVLRCLGRRGIDTMVPNPSDRTVTRSRWFARPPSTGKWDPDASLAEDLAGLDLERAVLIACSDALALAVAELPADVTDRFPSFGPRAETLRLLVDKGAFLGALEAAEVPHPKTYLVEESSQIAEVPRQESSRPLFIKPRDSQAFFHQFGIKGIRVRDRDELEKRVGELTAAGHRLVLQEYVPGPPSNHYFVDGFAREGGEILTHLVRRRLRMYPTDFGNSSLMVTVPPEEGWEAVEALRRLFRALEYRGIFSAEFKRDADDGVFRILEVNARPWWYIEFAARAGMDVAPMAYDAALGREPVASGDYQVGRRLIYPYYDLHACLETYPSRSAALWHFGRDAIGADHAVFAWDDPAPAMGVWSRLLTGFFSARMPARRRARVGGA